MGGDAGSDGEISEAEQKDRCTSQFECQDDVHLEKLKTEPSALDRPPKAPAMLTLPNDEHDIAHSVNPLSFFFLLFSCFFHSEHVTVGGSYFLSNSWTQ